MAQGSPDPLATVDTIAVTVVLETPSAQAAFAGRDLRSILLDALERSRVPITRDSANNVTPQLILSIAIEPRSDGGRQLWDYRLRLKLHRPPLAIGLWSVEHSETMLAGAPDLLGADILDLLEAFIIDYQTAHSR
jgi:hypothetical protein